MSTHLLCVHRVHMAERVVVETLQRQKQRKAELTALSNGAALVCIGLLLAQVYCLLAHQIQL